MRRSATRVTPQPPQPAIDASNPYFVQLGAYRLREQAEAAMAQALLDGLDSYIEESACRGRKHHSAHE